MQFSDVFMRFLYIFLFFFFNDTATTEIYTLSLHDALPIYALWGAHTQRAVQNFPVSGLAMPRPFIGALDRKSTRLNSSHSQISYAVFCLKKKKNRHSHHSITIRGRIIEIHVVQVNLQPSIA